MFAKSIVAAGLIFLQATCLALLGAGEAVARPGTPTGLLIWECEPSSRWQQNRFLAPPSLCVWFEDTATQRVRFEFEITVDGQPTPLSAFYAGCYRIEARMPGETCHSLVNGSVSDHARHQALYLGTDIRCWDLARNNHHPDIPEECRQLRFDATYCIRVRTRDEDGYVSEIWSAWACARTRPRPHAPSQPYVTVSTSRRGDQVTVSWGGGGDEVGTYDLSYRTSRTGINAGGFSSEVLRALSNNRLREAGRFTINISWADALDMEGEAYLYRACAVNIAGRTCSDWVSSLGDEMPRSMRNATYEEQDNGVSSVRQEPALDRTGAILAPQEDFEGLEQTGQAPSAARVTAGANTRVTPETPPSRIIAGAGLRVTPEQRQRPCIDGYTWRMARNPDPVCVTAQSYELTQSENAAAPSRVDPNGAWGATSCVSGYVWREAFDGDVVCVTPARREQVREETRLAPNFRAP